MSVVIPTQGRRPALLAQAIRSVWRQESQPRELVVVVDGDDAVCGRVREFMNTADLTVHALLHTGRPSGVSVARNLGAESASGSMLAFLDDDDLWLAGHLAAFDDGAFDVGMSSFLKLREDGTFVPEKTPPGYLHPRRFLVTNPGLRGSNLVIRRERFLAVGGFRPSLPALNDMDLGIRLAEVATTRYKRVRDRLVVFRTHRRERLTTAESASIRVGAQEFWRLYHHRMDEEERRRFVARAQALWRIHLGDQS